MKEWPGKMLEIQVRNCLFLIDKSVNRVSYNKEKHEEFFCCFVCNSSVNFFQKYITLSGCKL